ncbi:MAG TPA: DNA-3-methyladenine glycosylase [Candidatus Aquicultor sp.]|jgi:DNA-3-methyladenine glycosylase
MLTTKSITDVYNPLPVSFYERRTDEVAVDLLGKIIVRTMPKSVLVARIVETEAYFGENDPASHACRGMTSRNAIMFGRAGKAYVYLNYGVHSLLNVVTEPDGHAGAVLIRAIEPLSGVGEMFENRPAKSTVELTNGPGKLTKALSIDLRDNGADVTVPGCLFFADCSYDARGKCDGSNNHRRSADDAGKFAVAASSRIGISAGTDMLLRFTIDGNPYVSR